MNDKKDGAIPVRSNDLLDAIIHKLAKRIAEDLFHSGAGGTAKRLVLEMEDGKNAGGWCKAAVIDRIWIILKSVI